MTPEWNASRNSVRNTDYLDLTDSLPPATAKVDAAPIRVVRRIAALRCVEAIRLHAKAHGGKLPAKLADISEVPVPVDPWTGLPFEYRFDGRTAALMSSEQPGYQVVLTNAVHYSLGIAANQEGKYCVL